MPPCLCHFRYVVHGLNASVPHMIGVGFEVALKRGIGIAEDGNGGTILCHHGCYHQHHGNQTYYSFHITIIFHD